MALEHDRRQHRIVAEPGADAVGKQRQILAGVDRVAGQIGLRVVDARRGKHGQPDEVESIAGVDIAFERDQPLVEEPADQRRLAHRPRRADGDAAHRAINPEQRQLQAARALAAAFEILLEGGG